MIFGVGTDIIKRDRMRAQILQESDPFVQRTFTEKERKEAAEKSDPGLYFLGRFAAKEAVYKAMHLTPELVDLSSIEILTTSSGAPRVILHDQLRAYGQQQNIRKIHLSLSYEEDTAMAFAVAEVS